VRISIANERTECFPNIVPYHEIGEVILVGRFAIDDHQARAAILGHQRKSGRRPNYKRRSDRKKQIAML
jgi:hypothetical protein